MKVPKLSGRMIEIPIVNGEAQVMIRKGQRVTFKPEWRDPGDEGIIFVAVEDEDGGRVKVEAQLGLPINPVQVVEVSMIECAY